MRALVLLLVLVPTMALSGTPPAKDDDAKMVAGSADYSRTLRLVLEFKKGKLTIEELSKRIVALKLPPHHLGCGYVMAPVPAPPPGVPYEPALMPKDWVGTFGEVAMTFWRGDLTREQYEVLHLAAHGPRPGFPNCR